MFIARDRAGRKNTNMKISADEILDDYFKGIAQAEGYRPDEIPGFIDRQKKLLNLKDKEDRKNERTDKRADD